MWPEWAHFQLMYHNYFTQKFSNLAEYEGITFFKIDVDDHPDVSEAYDITSMPTFLFIKDGVVQDSVRGAIEEKIKASLDKLKEASLM